MKQDYKKMVIGAVASVTMVAGGAAVPAFADQVRQGAETDEAAVAEQLGASQATSGMRKVAGVEGIFAYDQTALTPNATIARVFRTAAAALCGATNDLIADNPLGWRLKVTGDVNAEFTANVGELANEESVKQVMTCSCGGNPADGAAIVTAAVKGIPVSHLLSKAQANSDVNAVTLIASDGTQETLPLGYVLGRHGVISYEVNDEDLSASMGGSNQLWMTRTSANYFVRDIVEVRFTREANPPADPGEDMDYPNSPNIGFLGTEA